MNYNNTFKGLFFIFKKFPIGLKENLREEDNLSTRDNWPVPNVSFVRRFYCSAHVASNVAILTGSHVNRSGHKISCYPTMRVTYTVLKQGQHSYSCSLVPRPTSRFDCL